MAKATLDTDLFKRLRDSGLRKRAARAIAEAGDNSGKLVRSTVDELRGLADQLESRARGGGSTSKSRSAGAKKAAATRKRQATKRSTAAKKAASTRAKSSGSSRSSSSRSGSSRSTSSRSPSTRSGGTRRKTSSSRSKS